MLSFIKTKKVICIKCHKIIKGEYVNPGLYDTKFIHEDDVAVGVQTPYPDWRCIGCVKK